MKKREMVSQADQNKRECIFCVQNGHNHTFSFVLAARVQEHKRQKTEKKRNSCL